MDPMLDSLIWEQSGWKRESPGSKSRGECQPVLLDPGRKLNDAFLVWGIPKSFVYDREGKMVAQSIDMRTRSQCQQMLAQAGLQ